MTVVTSLGCNFACPYCFEAKHPSLMDEAVQDRLLQITENKLATVGELSVLWYGGEPLVGRDALLRLSGGFRRRAAAAGAAYRAAMVTNGYLLTAEVATLLRDNDVRSAHVTLDGPAETHDRRRALIGGRGTFDTVLANIVAAADILPLSVRVNLDADNAGAYETLLTQMAGAGLVRLSTLDGGWAMPVGGYVWRPARSSEPKHGRCHTGRVLVTGVLGGRCMEEPDLYRAQVERRGCPAKLVTTGMLRRRW